MQLKKSRLIDNLSDLDGLILVIKEEKIYEYFQHVFIFLFFGTINTDHIICICIKNI